MPAIAIITDTHQPNWTDSDWTLVAPLQQKGITAVCAAWDDPQVDWKQFQALILRACFNYFRKPDLFRQWIAAMESAGIPLFNSPDIVRWNMDKHYLQDLAQQGVPTVPTIWLAQGMSVNLGRLMDQQGWSQLVMKPSVSAGAANTWLISHAEVSAKQTEFATLLQQMDWMAQPFMSSIQQGEWSLIYFKGEYSYTLLKKPAAGNIFVQHHHGGTAEIATPPDGFVEQGLVLLQKVEEIVGVPASDLLYARIDGLNENGILTLMELELIEPYLYLELVPSAAQQFAQAIASYVPNGVS